MNTPDPNKTQPLSDTEQEHLVAYLDGELDEIAEQQMLAELGQRPELRGEADALRKTWELLDFLPRPTATAHFTERTVQKLEQAKMHLAHRARWWQRLAIVGWLLMIASVGLVGFAIAYYWPEHDDAAASSTALASGPGAPQETAPENIRDEERLLFLLRQDIGRVLAELQPHLQPYERQELARKRRLGGLIFVEELLNLANKYKVPLQRLPVGPPGFAPGAGREDEPGGRPRRPRPTLPRPSGLAGPDAP